MAIVFNTPGAVFLLLGGIAAWTMTFVLWAIGLEQGHAFLATSPLVLVASGLDIASRYFDVFGTGATLSSRTIKPSAGGHLFFVPVWALTLSLYVLLFLFGSS